MLHINVNGHTEKKNGLTYLSWAWAWAEALKADPDATWEAVEYLQPDGTYSPAMYLANGTALVKTIVTVKGVKRSCMLPVMDHRNKAIPSPDAFAVNTAIMRCMTKTLAMHGLGLYIYAGEDLPQADAPETPEKKAEREKAEARQKELDQLALYMIESHEAGRDLDAIRVWYADDTWPSAEDKQDEQKYVWGHLQPHSKLRSTIKANHPERVKEAA